MFTQIWGLILRRMRITWKENIDILQMVCNRNCGMLIKRLINNLIYTKIHGRKSHGCVLWYREHQYLSLPC